MCDEKRWWVWSETEGWQECTYPFSETPAFGWNHEEGFYGRVFATKAEGPAIIERLMEAIAQAMPPQQP